MRVCLCLAWLLACGANEREEEECAKEIREKDRIREGFRLHGGFKRKQVFE